MQNNDLLKLEVHEIHIQQIQKNLVISDKASLMLAERTGLEPATPGVTGRYSNQLNYRSNF